MQWMSCTCCLPLNLLGKTANSSRRGWKSKEKHLADLAKACKAKESWLKNIEKMKNLQSPDLPKLPADMAAMAGLTSLTNLEQRLCLGSRWQEEVVYYMH